MVRLVITVAFELLLGPVSPVLFANSVIHLPLVAGKRPAVSLYEEYTLYSLDTSFTSLLPGRALSSLSNVATMLPKKLLRQLTQLRTHGFIFVSALMYKIQQPL